MQFRFTSIALALSAASLVFTGSAFAKGGVSGGSGGGGGGGGGGGATVCDTTPVLPTAAPAPDIIMRESFGAGNGLRPAGGNGCLRSFAIHTDLQGFWMEYPGSANTAWLASSTGQTWKVGAASTDPNEMPSPLQPNGANGAVISDWHDPVVDHPVALMPFTAPENSYQLSMDGFAAPLDGYYVGIGFTDSAVLYSNLETSAKAWLRLRPKASFDSVTSVYELRLNGMTGPALATGEVTNIGYNKLAIRYDPVAQMVGATVNDVDLGWYPLAMTAPKFVGFEGVGVLDNFVVKQLP